MFQFVLRKINLADPVKPVVKVSIKKAIIKPVKKYVDLRKKRSWLNVLFVIQTELFPNSQY